jgi:hypothetical protein
VSTYEDIISSDIWEYIKKMIVFETSEATLASSMDSQLSLPPFTKSLKNLEKFTLGEDFRNNT